MRRPVCAKCLTQADNPIHQRAFVVKECMDAHRRIELRLAIRRAEFRPAIKTDRQLRVVNFACLREAHRVSARHKPRASYSCNGNLRGRRHTRRFCAHRPHHPIQAGSFAGRQFIDNTPGGIQNFELHFSKQMTLALVVIDHGSVRRIIANKNGIAVGPAALAFDSLLHRTRRNERNVLLQQIRSQRAQRSDVVNNPDPAAVCRKNQIVIARLNCQIANGNGGKMVAFKLRPVFSTIDRDPKSKFGAEKKKIWLDQILLDYVRVSANAFRVLGCNKRRPGLTVISRLENVRRPSRQRYVDQTRRKPCRD